MPLAMKDVLGTYDRISLEEMKDVRLMNRIDTKYVTTVPVLIEILKRAKPNYYAQFIDGECMMPYYTLYYDTEDTDMYIQHLRGRKRRQKIRIRKYEATNISFLEVKNKNNKGRTKKKRTEYLTPNEDVFTAFITEHGNYPVDALLQMIENRFTRLTLVNKNKTERLTIDTNLRFHNLVTQQTCRLDDLVIIELKRDGNTHSPILEVLRELRVQPAKFSKYCMGMAITNPKLKNNRFKPRLRYVEKLCNINRNIKFNTE